MEEKNEKREIEKSVVRKLSFKKEVYKKVFLTGLALLFVAYLFAKSNYIFSGIGVFFGIISPFILGAVFAFIMKNTSKLL